MTSGSDQRLQDSVDQITALLHRNQLVEHVVHTQQQSRQELVENLVHRQQLTSLQAKLRQLHVADAAHVLDVLPPDDRRIIWSLIDHSVRGDVFLEVTDTVREQLVEAMSEEELHAMVADFDANDLAFARTELPEALVEQAMRTLAEADQHWVRSSMAYGEDTVGHLMSRELITLRADQSIAEATQFLRSHSTLPHNTDKLFVVDSRGSFQGFLLIEDMIMQAPEAQVSEVMHTNAVTFNPEDSAYEVALAFDRYDLASAPVVSGRHRLMGRITVDQLLDPVREEAHDDVLNIAGLQREEDLFSNVRDAIRNRWLWLFVNLITAFIASRIIDGFGDAITQLVALAALMPIVASVGGNTGNQTTALVVRGLALNQIHPGNLGHILRKEFSVAVINGLIWGGVLALVTLLFYTNPALSAVLMIAMLLNMIVAAFVGVMVPFTLHRLGRDPAMGASVLLTFSTDSMGFLIFLTLASQFLV